MSKETERLSKRFNLLLEKKREELKQENIVELKDIIKLSDLTKTTGIERQELIRRLQYLVEGIEYRKLGERQPIILTPKGAEKLLNME